MQCPFCDSETFVKGTRETDDGEKVVRRRECERGHRFRTTEWPGELLVRKEAGHLEPFDKAKVARGVKTALYKWTDDEKEAWAEGWEAARRVRAKLLEPERLGNRESIEVEPSEIGELVLEQLKGINWFGWLSYLGVFMEERTDIDSEERERAQREIEAQLDKLLRPPEAPQQ